MDQVRYATGPEVMKRYSITGQTLIRWTRDETLGFPQPLRIRGRNFWNVAELDAFDQRQRTFLSQEGI